MIMVTKPSYRYVECHSWSGLTLIVGRDVKGNALVSWSASLLRNCRKEIGFLSLLVIVTACAVHLIRYRTRLVGYFFTIQVLPFQLLF